MPSKEINDVTGRLYLVGEDGEPKELLRTVTGVEMDVESVEKYHPDIFKLAAMPSFLDEEMTFTCNSFKIKQTYYFVLNILGLPVPNNWLKMHGKPMKRKKVWRHKSKRKG